MGESLNHSPSPFSNFSFFFLYVFVLRFYLFTCILNIFILPQFDSAMNLYVWRSNQWLTNKIEVIWWYATCISTLGELFLIPMHSLLVVVEDKTSIRVMDHWKHVVKRKNNENPTDKAFVKWSFHEDNHTLKMEFTLDKSFFLLHHQLDRTGQHLFTVISFFFFF